MRESSSDQQIKELDAKIGELRVERDFFSASLQEIELKVRQINRSNYHLYTSMRKVLSWRLSNTMDADFCVDALQDAIAKYGTVAI